ncbi:hypothetical protein P872_22915 [Rhodonellum psychrophilum GCM71 = DSM 17998]|uniref:Uncharacterized protein n=1 Tax=Rhodonellum psychrophilum GCM71 = DSM 17998 TaxID=1123057 RepID=U5C7J2_9BACT|nr:hypothetical protein P872_22915 [Rhodonellum psychrophilum GCM71 = DSM 17998]
MLHGFNLIFFNKLKDNKYLVFSQKPLQYLGFQSLKLAIFPLFQMTAAAENK